MKKFAIAIHRGAGTILHLNMISEKEMSYKKAMENAINAGTDACIMDGKNLMAGAVAGISNIKNPIILARPVREKSNIFF